MKTDAGSVLWNNLETSKRTIYFNSASPGGESKAEKNAYLYMVTGSSPGATVSKSEYEAILANGSSNEVSFNKANSFNIETGEFDKTSDYDETHILFDVDIMDFAVEELMKTNPSLTNEQAYDLVVNKWISEEGFHALQNYGDYFPKLKDKNGKYIKPQYNSKRKPYLERRSEKEAKRNRDKVVNKYKEENNLDKIDDSILE